MVILKAVAKRQVLVPLVSTDMSAATGTFTVDDTPGDDPFTITVAGEDISVDVGSDDAETTDNIADEITTLIAADTITTVATAASDGTSVVTLTAESYGTDGNSVAISSDEGNVTASGSTLSGAGSGVVIGDITIKASSGSAYLSDPTTTLQLSLTELDSDDAPGWYELVLVPAEEGLIYLTVSVADYSEEFVLQVDHQGLDLLGATYPGAEGDYTFTVEDASENPVEGAVVRVYDSEGTGLILRSTTDSSGEITFALPAGDYQVRTNLRGYDFSDINPTEITVTANESNTPVISELVPAEASEDDVIAIVGMYFDDEDTEVLFSGEPEDASSVSEDGKVLTVTVPSGDDTAVTIKVRKPDPDDSSSYLTSGTLTLVRS